MTDKVQKILKEVERLHSLLPVMDGDNISVNYADRICTALKMYIDSLQKEHVSEDLEESANNALKSITGQYGILDVGGCLEMFKLGAKWKEEQMMMNVVDGEILEVEDDPHAMCISTHLEVFIEDDLKKLGLKADDKVKIVIIKSK